MASQVSGGPSAFKRTSTSRCPVTAGLSVEQKVSHSAGGDKYLKLRIRDLNSYQRHVILMIDEIYVAKRVELTASRGEISGFTPETEVATTILCFMVKSACGKYKDMVRMEAVPRLTEEEIQRSPV